MSSSSDKGIEDGRNGRIDLSRFVSNEEYKRGYYVGERQRLCPDLYDLSWYHRLADDRKAEHELAKEERRSQERIDEMHWRMIDEYKEKIKELKKGPRGRGPGEENHKAKIQLYKNVIKTLKEVTPRKRTVYDEYGASEIVYRKTPRWVKGLIALAVLGVISSPFLDYTIKKHFPSKEVKKVWDLEYMAKYGGWERHIAADDLKKYNGKYDNHPYIKHVKEKRKEELTKMWNKKYTLEYLSQFKDPEKRKKAEQWLITYYDAIYGANCKDLAPIVRLRCHVAVNQLKFQGKTKPSGVMY